MKAERAKPVRRMLAAGILLVMLLLFLSSGPGTASADLSISNPFIQEMINQVQPEVVQDTIAGLSGEQPVLIDGSPYTIKTRFTLEEIPIQKATQLVYEHFQSRGLSVEYFWYTHTFVGTQRSVIAEQPGRTQPDCIYLLSAHLDDAPMGNLAPGADDNASGSTGVLLAADILSQYEFNCTMRYALFTGEEQGLLGSKAYAAYVNDLGEDIRGVLNLDMIAYNSDDQANIDLHIRQDYEGDLAIANLFENVVRSYAIDLLPEFVPDGASNSDQAAFWYYGYPGILAIEDSDDASPYYHSVEDRLETLDIPYFTNFIQAAVGTFAHLGGLLEGQITGIASDAQTGEPLPGVVVQAERASGPGWSTITGEDGGYIMALPSGSYTVTAALPAYATCPSETEVLPDQTTNLDLPLQKCQLVEDANFAFAPQEPRAGEMVTFTASATVSNSIPVEFFWDFGDNSSGQGQVITHTYASSQTYPVVMTAATCAGPVAVTHNIQIAPAPDIDITPAALEVWLDVGESITGSLTLSNTGAATLFWTLEENPNTTWVESLPLSGTTAAGSYMRVWVAFTAPASGGVYKTDFIIHSNDPDKPLVKIPVILRALPIRSYLPFLMREPALVIKRPVI